ncbi:MAG TPA: hypothetical protein VIF62_19060 [Labilithrix sp.]
MPRTGARTERSGVGGGIAAEGIGIGAYGVGGARLASRLFGVVVTGLATESTGGFEATTGGWGEFAMGDGEAIGTGAEAMGDTEGIGCCCAIGAVAGRCGAPPFAARAAAACIGRLGREAPSCAFGASAAAAPRTSGPSGAPQNLQNCAPGSTVPRHRGHDRAASIAGAPTSTTRTGAIGGGGGAAIPAGGPMSATVAACGESLGCGSAGSSVLPHEVQ